MNQSVAFDLNNLQTNLLSDLGRINIVKLLLEHEANVDLKDKDDKKTALHYAVAAGNF